MFENESLSDTEDPFPRNAPKPSINNFDQLTAKPSVPEVSIIFDQANKPFQNLHVERKPILKSTPIIPNQQHPIPPKATIPELSLIFEPNEKLIQIPSTSKEALSKQIQIEKHKPSLPIKSFSNFKLKYGSLISSMENTTRKSVKFKPIHNQNCSKDIEKNIEQLDFNDGSNENSIIEQEINTVTNIPEGKFVNDNILDKIDSLMSLVHSLVDEIKDVKKDIKELKNQSSQIVSEQTINSQNCNDFNNKIEEIIKFNEYIYNNMENFTKTTKSNVEFTKQTPLILDNLNIQKIKTRDIEETLNTSTERITKPSKQVPDKKSHPTSCIKKTDLLESLPESEPVLVFNNDVNRSYAMKELALKYLTNDKYKIYINGNNTPVNLKTNFQMEQEPIINEQQILKKSTDLSIATYDYMNKYKLFVEDDRNFGEPINYENNTNHNDNLVIFHDIKKGPKFM